MQQGFDFQVSGGAESLYHGNRKLCKAFSNREPGYRAKKRPASGVFRKRAVGVVLKGEFAGLKLRPHSSRIKRPSWRLAAGFACRDIP